MVIDLTASEKSTFIRFLSLYLGSSFLLMLMVAFFYFQNEKTLYYDLTKSNMQNVVSQISSKIIFAHMTNKEFDKNYLLKTDDYKISFYDENKNKIFGNLEDRIDFTKTLMEHQKHFILIDSSTLGHLGVYYIAIKENLFFEQISKLKMSIVFIFLFIYLIIAIIGFYLAKLFLKPIKDEREKLNNFIKDTTHELNTPISAILMSTESNTLNEKQIERIRISAKRVSELYKDLTYIFLQNSYDKKSIEIVNLKQIIIDQLEYFQPLAVKKKIDIKLKLEDFEYKIDKDDFIRIFNNLISNAIKYNKISGTIEIKLENKSLEISDSGIGIEQNKLKDVFKRYYRATTEQGGFGIGLSIVNQICNNYNIKISVNSQLKKGSTFTLTF
ncbi:two-component system sensor histidine kinase, putative CusS [Arcobacter acticola]|uniref:histidine kinase n=1 Tax=Arcobacter acticola TaxID=1849015 RepID=A0A6M8ES72_9BACT|nr:HAMP domain-containing sensor histidine kinase [Arcobacter acticola]QKE27375.1 two-component system sensor histidine kinase, putative CusS [Arcobacter acticola]